MTSASIRGLTATMSLPAYFKTNAPWLLSGGIMTFASSFGQTFYISLFADDIMGHYLITDGQWGGYYALGTVISGLAMIWAGSLTDHFRVRVLAPVLLVMLCVLCLLMSGNSTLWALPVIIFGLRFCGQGMMHHVAMVAMARWFTQTRGRAISLASMGYSLAEACLPLLVVALLAVFSWQAIWQGSAVACLMIIPIMLYLLRSERTPREVAQSSEAVGMKSHFWTRRDALRHFLFWSLLPMLLMPPILGTALLFQQVHFSEAKGWGHANYVTLFPLYTAVSIASVLAYGWLIDRIGAVRLMPFYQIPFAAGFLVLSYADTMYGAALGLVLVATMHGGYATTSVAFWAEAYGTRHLGTIKAAAAAIMVFGSGIGPWMSGGLIDKGWDFASQLPFYAVGILAGCMLTYIVCKKIEPDLPTAPQIDVERA